MPDYVDLNSVDDPTTGEDILAAWGDQVRDNFEAGRDPFRCKVNNGFENVTSGGAWTVTFANEIYDNDGMFAGPSQTITIQHTGLYDVRATAEFDYDGLGGVGRRFLQCVHDSLGSLGDTDLPPSTGTKTDFGLILPDQPLTAGDELTFIVNQSSGVTLLTLVAVSVRFICP